MKLSVKLVGVRGLSGQVPLLNEAGRRIGTADVEKDGSAVLDVDDAVGSQLWGTSTEFSVGLIVKAKPNKEKI